MLKTKYDFDNYDDFCQYAKTGEFLFAYSWEGKSRGGIIQEMALPDFEIEFLDVALKELKMEKNVDYSGMALDRRIMRKYDESIDDDFDEYDVVYIERDE